MYVSNRFTVKLLPAHLLLELLTVTLHCGNYRSCLSLFYRPPSPSVEILSHLHNCLQSINIPQFSSFVLIGDFNINFFDSAHPSFSNLCNILSIFGLTQVVSDHTHIHQGHSYSLIDLVLMSNPSCLSSCQIIPPLSNSDHLGIKLEMQLKGISKSVRPPRRTIWHYSHADWDKAWEKIQAFNWDSLLSEDINLSWVRWHSNFMSIMEECIPKKALSSRRNLPWLNKDIRSAMRKRNTLLKKTGYSAKFRSARNRVIGMLHRAKANYFKNLNPKDSKKFWKSIKYLNKQQPTIPTLQQGEQTASTDQQKAALLNSYFSACFNRSHPPPAAFDPPPSPQHDPSLVQMHCTIPEVEHLLQGLDVTKASGPDKVSAQMLKCTASCIAPSVTKLFNLSIRVGRIPDSWKESMIAPIPKSSTKSSDPGNYRPISLTCNLCKLLEKHIYGLMYEHLSNQQVLTDSQWGFRSGRSTVTALLSVTQEWLSALERGQEIGAVFFDYRKAFDSVPHRPLLEKLENIGFNNHILRWITDYLTSRSQTVVVNGESSQSAPVLSGVPQGSVLGPLLFLIYINDLTDINIEDGAKITLYADDVLLFRIINSPEDFVALQEDIDKIGSWSCANFLTLNRTKCKYIIVSRKTNLSTPSSPLLLEGHPLDQVEMFQYLGVLLSHDLTWGEHVQSTCKKARKILGLLYRRFYNNAPGNSLLQLYLSLVRPHLDYASAVWSPYLIKDKAALECPKICMPYGNQILGQQLSRRPFGSC